MAGTADSGEENAAMTEISLGQRGGKGSLAKAAQRVQRGRDDVRVMIRYPESERRSLGSVCWLGVGACGSGWPSSASGSTSSFSRCASAVKRASSLPAPHSRAE